MADQPSFAMLGANRFIPVVTFADVKDAVPVARALLAGGVSVIEVTLRTPAGLEAMRLLRSECPDMMMGAGTVLSAAQADAVAEAGAKFLVSPGHTAALVDKAKSLGLPWMLGATSLSECMSLREHGFKVQKFFPAEPSGGTATLKAIGSVLPDVRFCPTGGITPDTARTYLALSNVIAVGGSWFVPAKDVDLEKVTEAARRASTALVGN